MLFVFLLCPETGSRTLERIDDLFIGGGLTGLRKDPIATSDDMERYSASDEKPEEDRKETTERDSADL